MNKQELQEYRQLQFEVEYKILRQTMKHSKAIHSLKDKYGYCYHSVTKFISKKVENECSTPVRKMKRLTKKSNCNQLQLFDKKLQ